MVEILSGLAAHGRTIGEISGMIFVLGIVALYGLVFALVRRPWHGWFVLFVAATTTALLVIAGSCDARRKCAPPVAASPSAAGGADASPRALPVAAPAGSEGRRS